MYLHLQGTMEAARSSETPVTICRFLLDTSTAEEEEIIAVSKIGITLTMDTTSRARRTLRVC
jgi:hypothetical protein